MKSIACCPLVRSMWTFYLSCTSLGNYDKEQRNPTTTEGKVDWPLKHFLTELPDKPDKLSVLYCFIVMVSLDASTRLDFILLMYLRDEVTGEWRKLHNEELSDLYSLPNIVRVVKSRRMRWAGHVARMGEGRGVHRVLVGKPEGKRPLGRPRRRWEDNIKMDLQEVGGGCGYWMELAQDRDRWRALVSTVMNFLVPKMRGIS